MENTILSEATDTLKKLTPQNQDYFMTLLRVAAVAEDAVKEAQKSIANQNAESSLKTDDILKTQKMTKKSKRTMKR